MKKIFKLIVFLIPLLLLLAACDKDHIHTFSEEWTKDAVGHWHSPTCDHKDVMKDYGMHTFGEWVVKTEASDGEVVSVRTCTVCGYEETSKTKPDHIHTFADTYSSDDKYHWFDSTCHPGETSPKELHKYGEWEIITAPTESTKGSKSHTCSVCGHVETVEIPVLPHTHTFETAYTSDDNYHWHKSTCNHPETEIKEVHTYGDWIAEREATEEEVGLKYKECSVCGHKYYEEIPVLPHTHKFSEEWSSNSTSHWHDSTCGHNVLSNYGAHSFGDWVVITEATNDTDGLRERICSVCGYVEREIIEAPHHVHTFSDEWSTDEYNHWHECTCGHDLVDSLGEHEFSDWEVITQATEETEGLQKRTCTVCGYEETKVIPTIGHVHTFSDELAYDAVYHYYPATCGHDERKDAEKHTFVLKEVVLPTCTEKGYSIYVCTVCGYETKLLYTEPIGHDYNAKFEWNDNNTKVVITLTCSHCHDTKVFEYNVTPVRTESTCEEHGNITSSVEFEYNGQTFRSERIVELDVLGHEFEFDCFIWDEDTCTAKAHLVCQNDNSHTLDVRAIVTEKETIPSTCTTKGHTTFTLSYEGHTEEKTVELELDSDVHSYVFDHFVWDEEHKTAKAVLVCEYNNEHTTEVNATVSLKGTTPSTCKTHGVSVYTLSYRGNTEDKEVELPLDSEVHEYSEEWSHDEEGHWHECTCEHEVEVSKEEHTYGAWTVVTPATTTSEGVKVRTCSVCGYEETETIPVLTNEVVWLDTIYSGNYYDTIDSNLLDDTNALKQALHTLVSSNYTRLSYSNAFTALNTIDSYDGGHYVECLYTGEKMDPANHGYWNREHVWAKSHGIKTADDSNTSDGNRIDAYSDLHHLRATENSINSTRNNRYFDEVSHSLSHDAYENYWDASNAFEPRDEVKGDIARMLFYMTIKYDGSEDAEYLRLILTDDASKLCESVNYVRGTTTVIESYLGKLSTLVKWAYDDPVDDREISRNNAIYSVQGNRNPFIDHPELVYYIFNTESVNAGVSTSTLPIKVEPKRKNAQALTNVDNLITAIGTVTKDSGQAITAARNAFNALDELSKSFVEKYYLLKAVEGRYIEVSTEQNTTIDTTFYFVVNQSLGEEGLKGSKSGTLFKNGVYLEYLSTASTAPSDNYGLYSQNNKNVTFNVTGLYDVSKVVFKADSTNKSISGTIKITDGTQTVSGSFTSPATAKTYTNFEVNVSSLDHTKKWTITVDSATSWRIPQLTFEV